MNPPLLFESVFGYFTNPVTATGALWLFVKVLYLLGFAMYVLFSLVVIRQVYMMTNTYKSSAEALLRTLAILHCVVALGALLVALLIL